MDKIKTLLRPLSKHMFWIGCGLILVISMFSWYTARGGLQKEFDENLGKIKTSFQSANTLKTKTNPPNDHSNEQMDKVIDNALQLVVQAWQKQYSHQEMILRWPQELGDDFVKAVRPLKPIELKVEPNTTPQQDMMKVDFRQRYSNYVERLLPKLAELINSRWTPGRPAASMEMTGMGTTGIGTTGVGPTGMVPGGGQLRPELQPPLVIWDGQDQARLLAMHFDWSKQPDAAPTTLQVLYAQEDLWVLTALMWIIKKTNGDIEARHEAVVKTIESVMIGRSAVGRSGQVLMLAGRNPMGDGMSPMGPGYGESEYSAEMGGETGTTTSTGSAEMGSSESMGLGDAGMAGAYMAGGDPMSSPGAMAGVALDPANFRYVDNEYKPLSAKRVREAMQAGAPEDAFLVVAKRMPIRLRLVVDQRKLHRLLAEFGNSALPVEIRQIRINRAASASGGGMGGYGGGYGGGGYGGGYGSEMGGYGGGGYGEEMGGYGGAGYGGGMAEMMGSTGYGSEMDAEAGYGYGTMTPDYGMGYGGDYGTTGAANIKDRKEVSSTTSYDVPVEVWGIIYIYNPVDGRKLGTEQPPATAAVPTTTVTAG